MIATRGNHVVICCHFFFINFFRRGSGVAREHPSSASIPVQGQRIWDCLNLGCKDTGGKLIHSRIDNYSQCLPFLTLCNARKTETMEFVIQFIYIGNFAQTRVPFFSLKYCWGMTAWTIHLIATPLSGAVWWLVWTSWCLWDFSRVWKNHGYQRVSSYHSTMNWPSLFGGQ